MTITSESYERVDQAQRSDWHTFDQLLHSTVALFFVLATVDVISMAVIAVQKPSREEKFKPNIGSLCCYYLCCWSCVCWNLCMSGVVVVCSHKCASLGKVLCSTHVMANAIVLFTFATYNSSACKCLDPLGSKK